MNIVCIKLTTGEDIIGRVVNQMMTEKELPVGGKVTLSQVRVISLQEIPTPQGPRMAMALLPFLMGNHDADITIDLDSRSICTYTAVEPIETSYIQQTSPIDTTTAKPKIAMP